MEVDMDREHQEVSPMVREPTRTQSENVETIINRLNNGRIIIPDYQRDAEQWDPRKESLFIESLLNNLTIPALFFLENQDSSIEVVDGQQRLNTILKFVSNELTLEGADDINYLSQKNVYYSGKKFSQLPPKFQSVFNDYPLTIVYLPPRLDLATRLEIFRRINEGGTPLTAQDIRLSYYSKSKSVYFVRLAGIYADTPPTNRMITAARKKGVDNPWNQYAKTENLLDRLVGRKKPKQRDRLHPQCSSGISCSLIETSWMISFQQEAQCSIFQ